MNSGFSGRARQQREKPKMCTGKGIVKARCFTVSGVLWLRITTWSLLKPSPVPQPRDPDIPFPSYSSLIRSWSTRVLCSILGGSSGKLMPSIASRCLELRTGWYLCMKSAFRFQNWVSRIGLETQFWNLNALFMHKYHPVRSSKHLLAIDGISLPEEPPKIEHSTRVLQERISEEYEGKGMSGSRGWGTGDGFNNDQVVIRYHITPETLKHLAFTISLPLP